MHETIAYAGAAPAGADLPSVTTVGAKVSGRPAGSADEDVRVTELSYEGQAGVGYKLRKPTATIVDAVPGGLNLKRQTFYDRYSGQVTETRMPKHPDGNDPTPYDTKTIYWTADGAGNANGMKCGNRPELANLPCKVTPAAQLAGVPVTTYEYNMLNQVTKETETTTASTRTTTTTYDGAGREAQEAISGGDGAPLPAVTTSYHVSTGRLAGTSATEGGVTRTVSRSYDALGRLTGYTDADGITSTTTYDLLSRPVTMNDGKGSQTRSYDADSGLLTRVEDSAAGAFTATYDEDGHLTRKTLPNGLVATTRYDEAGSATKLTYEKTTNCNSSCTWLDFEVTQSIHGQWLTHRGTLSDQDYAYDNAGRLIEVKDTVEGGAGCTLRRYAYDADSNRASLQTVPPRADGSCDTSSPGQTRSYSYDAADRIVDPGFSYDGFGRTTIVPASHAGGSPLTSSYYANDFVRSTSQAGKTVTIDLDPQGRPRQRTTTGLDTEIAHYADDSDSPSWTRDKPDGSAWTRTVEGIDGDLVAIQTESGATLQLQNLHGDVVATATLSDTATAPASTFESDEFGVSRQGASTRRYRWVGAKQRRSELDSGVITMGVRLYVPQLGRFTQVDPIPGGSANAYEYAGQDPVNKLDLDGQWCVACVVWAGRLIVGWGAKKFGGRVVARYVARGAGRRAVGPLKGYTRHGLNQAISRDGGRGVHPRAIVDAVKRPQWVKPQSGGRRKYVGENAVVVLNKRGQVVATWARNRGGLRTTRPGRWGPH